MNAAARGNGVMLEPVCAARVAASVMTVRASADPVEFRSERAAPALQVSGVFGSDAVAPRPQMAGPVRAKKLRSKRHCVSPASTVT
ncbi:MAG: hypothetical protein R2705_24075 [Ilumatobacteraceae bacterium]